MDTIFGVPHRRLKQLQDDRKKGIPVSTTQAENDALHTNPTEENLKYWNDAFSAAADTDIDRINRCNQMRQYIMLVITPHADDDNPLQGDISSILTEVDNLPCVH